MKTIFAVDPGLKKSGYIVYSPDYEDLIFNLGILPNIAILRILEGYSGIHPSNFQVVIEGMEIYGVKKKDERGREYALGRTEDVVQTLVWIGKFAQAWRHPYTEIKRSAVKKYLSVRDDAGARAAIIDRFGGSKEKAIGLKKTPGPLYGIKSHLWAALALAVVYDEMGLNPPESGFQVVGAKTIQYPEEEVK